MRITNRITRVVVALTALALAIPMLVFLDLQPQRIEAQEPAHQIVLYTEPKPFEGQGSNIWRINPDGSGRVQLTRSGSASLDNTRPMLSPDGSRIVYTVYEGFWPSLWVMDADGSNPRKIPFQGAATRAVWSPDGAKLAFYSDIEDWWEIWIMESDGSNPRRLTTHGPAAGEISWSPDGTKLAYGVEPSTGKFDLYTVNSDGTGQQLLLAADQTGFSHHQPVYSPDGIQIAVVRTSLSDSSQKELWLINADGSGGRMLARNIEPTGWHQISWSADGQWIIFGKNGQIWRVRSDGSNATPVTTEGGWEGSIGTLADPSALADYLIVFADPRAGSNSNANIWRMRGDGSERIQLTHSQDDESQPNLSPDATQIAYMRHNAALKQWQLWLMNADGSNQRQLSQHVATGRPVWSPNGKQIVFQSDAEDWWEIWVVNADGTNEHRLTTTIDPAGEPSWSPDGQTIIYGAMPNIFLVDSDGSNQRPFLLSSETPYANHFPFWSPDGETIALLRWPSTAVNPRYDLWLMPADGGAGRLLVTDVEYPYQRVSWTPDSNWLVFGKNGQLWRVRRDGSSLAPITGQAGWEPSLARDPQLPTPTTTPTRTVGPTRTPTTTPTPPPPTETPTPRPTQPPATDCTLQINDGARFTNQLSVSLNLNVNSAAQMQVSNDGGFGEAVWQPYQRTVDWTLEDPGPRIATILVFARFVNSRSSTLCGGQVIDSIFYDPLPPTLTVQLAPTAVRAAAAASPGPISARLRLTAADQPGGSGVAAVQVSTTSNFSGASWQPFTDTIDLSAQPGARVYVRVRDSVGNLSAPATILLSPASGEARAVYLALMRW